MSESKKEVIMRLLLAEDEEDLSRVLVEGVKHYNNSWDAAYD